MRAKKHILNSLSVLFIAALGLAVFGCHQDSHSAREQTTDNITAKDAITGDKNSIQFKEDHIIINNIIDTPSNFEETSELNNKDNKSELHHDTTDNSTSSMNNINGTPPIFEKTPKLNDKDYNPELHRDTAVKTPTSTKDTASTKMNVQNNNIHISDSSASKGLSEANNPSTEASENAEIQTGNSNTNTYIPINILFGKPKVTGYLDMRIVREIFMHHKADLRKCYTKEFTNAKSSEANITIKITISQTGNISKLTMPGATLKSRTKECLYNAIYRWQFPASKNGDLTYVEYPISLSWHTE